ncbi:L-aspartate oxidase [Nitratireductor luteus]|uniref:L-aspartate oxidase n=1 Tax=Nitratireductor luteus TaxID=2976980 RepID=UPI00223FC892|nr:L-aspartate oxidase [Nitratireductor luteus]
MNPAQLAGRPVIVGGGIAGLMTALHLAPEPVVLLSKGPLSRFRKSAPRFSGQNLRQTKESKQAFVGRPTNACLGTQSSSELAQGGLAAALGDDDTPALHARDTLAAGDGLCDVETVRRLAEAAPRAIETLQRFGVRFDRSADGSLRLGLEAAHGRKRIVHAAGDGTGREIMRALLAAVRSLPSIAVVEHMEARRLLLADGAVSGVLAAGQGGAAVFQTGRVVIATGGIGGLFEDTTNPPGCWGQGLLLAARAGAELADLEFIQFHPTALDASTRPMRLVSEAVRGEGAVLVDETGERFLECLPGAELAPRAAVARAMAAHLEKGHKVFVDARDKPGKAFQARFPAIHAFCRQAGIDPVRAVIPVRPAAHYHMGGIAVDAAGRSTVPGLWACGEAASTGLHGANRLASNSLIEAAACAEIVARDVSGAAPGSFPQRSSIAVPPPLDPTTICLAAIRPIVSRALGVVRRGEDLRRAIVALLPLAQSQVPAADPALLALMIAVAAHRRAENRGAHCRADFPKRQDPPQRARLTLEKAIAVAHLETARLRDLQLGLERMTS